jgi:hypothetical protein
MTGKNRGGGKGRLEQFSFKSLQFSGENRIRTKALHTGRWRFRKNTLPLAGRGFARPERTDFRNRRPATAPPAEASAFGCLKGRTAGAVFSPQVIDLRL